LWQLTTEPVVDKLEAAAAEMGVEIKNARVAEPPELHPGFSFYVEAFWWCHSCRAQGVNSVPPIPWLAYHEYAQRYKVTGPDFYRFQFFMDHMDTAFCDYMDEKRQTRNRMEEVKRKNRDGKGNTAEPNTQNAELRNQLQARRRENAE
jgi:hypothetical protein